MTHRVWFWYDNMFRFMPGELEVGPGTRPTDAQADFGVGLWSDADGLLEFFPKWCRKVTMRECQSCRWEGRWDIRTTNVEVEWW